MQRITHQSSCCHSANHVCLGMSKAIRKGLMPWLLARGKILHSLFACGSLCRRYSHEVCSTVLSPAMRRADRGVRGGRYCAAGPSFKQHLLVRCSFFGNPGCHTSGVVYYAGACRKGSQLTLSRLHALSLIGCVCHASYGRHGRPSRTYMWSLRGANLTSCP